MKKFIMMVFLLSLTACATPQTTLTNIPKAGNVGVVVALDEQPIHFHLGTTIFQNNRRELDSDWEVTSLVEQEVKMNLSANPGLNVIMLDSDDSIRDSLTGKKEQAQATREKFFADNDLELLIEVLPISREVEYDSGVYAKGYGVFTRCFFGRCRAYALNHYATRIITPENVATASNWGTAKDPKPQIAMEFPEGVKNMSASEGDKARGNFASYMKANIKSALQNSGLIAMQTN